MSSLFVALAVFAVWMVTAGSWAPSEWVAGAGVGALGVLLSRRLARALPVGGPAPWRWLKGVPLAIAQIPGDTLKVVVEVLRLLLTGRPPRAGLHVIDLPEGPADASPEAWDAFVTAVLSTSPNTIVVGMDPARRTLVAHRFVAGEVSTLREAVERLT